MADQKPFSFDEEHPRDPFHEMTQRTRKHQQFSDDTTPAYKLHRREGPDTSKASAESLTNLNELEMRVLVVIRSFGHSGCISDEVRDHFGGKYSITARYKALLEKGWIIDTGERRKGRSGRMQRVMRAVSY